VNDDLGAFGRLPQQFGYAAAQLEGDLVYIRLCRQCRQVVSSVFDPMRVRRPDPAATW
jgi:hypothetical protein